MSTQKGGKQATRGSKQIVKENEETLVFYRNMILGAAGIYFGIGIIFFNEFPKLDLFLATFAGLVFACCYRFMSSMSTTKLGADGSILDEGCDLNIEGGIAEHIKDLVILTSVCLVLSSYCTWLWLIWLLAPTRAFQMLWTNILGPWFFAPAPEDEKENQMDKKQMKRERRMKYKT